MEKTTIPIFSRKDPEKFFKTLTKRVNNYFKGKNIKKTGNWRLWLKTGIMFALYFVPYCILMLNVPGWLQIPIVIIMGIGMAGIGMNVMHDANHGSYSSKKWVNKIMGSSIYILAGNVYNWQVQHNVLHHTYTNIHGHDEDLDAGRILRFSPIAKWAKRHKLQHWYGIFLYGLLTINWVATTDFKQTKKYLKRKLSFRKFPNPIRQWITVIISKIIYLTIFLVIPIMYSGVSWWKIIIGFFIIHYVAGIILGLIFQLAHVVEDTEMPEPDELGKMENTWAIHQLHTTANFGTQNKFMNWFSGGLNHQVEHHLFQNISHIHYVNLGKIVRATAKECDLPYKEYRTTYAAFKAHVKHLKNMAMDPSLSKA
jgi:linoleoyl-CoA desaturase